MATPNGLLPWWLGGRIVVLAAAITAVLALPRRGVQAASGGADVSDPSVVTVPGLGTIGGYVDSAKGIRRFRGVPYAQPPVGDLRWRDPVKVRDPHLRATGHGSRAMLRVACYRFRPSTLPSFEFPSSSDLFVVPHFFASRLRRSPGAKAFTTRQTLPQTAHRWGRVGPVWEISQRPVKTAFTSTFTPPL